MQFSASIEVLSDMLRYIRNQAEIYHLDEKLIYKIELACEEALVNVISYAYPHEKGMVDLHCEKKNGRFEITLRDRGVLFNPIDAEIQPQLNIPIQERKIGGLGIFLMRKSIDEASYQRVGEENVLRMAFQI